MGYPRALSNWFVFFVGIAVALPAHARPITKAEANQVIAEGEYFVKSGRRIHHSPRSRAPIRYRVASHSTRKKESRHSVRSAKKFGRTKTRASRKIASAPGRDSRHRSKHRSNHSSKHSLKRAESKHHAKHAKKTARSAPRHQAAKSAKRRFPVARETPNERDMPFVSIPHRKISHHDRTIVMEDPAVRAPLPPPRAPTTPELKPDAAALSAPEGEPDAVGRAKAEMAPPPVVGPAPASVTETPAADAAPAVAPTVPEVSAVPPEAAAAAAAQANGRDPDAFDLHSGADPLQNP